MTGRLVRAGVVIALVVGLVLLAQWAFRSDTQRLSDSVDDARDALVEGRDAEFLAFFASDVRYLGDRDHTQLEKDLARWRATGLREARILGRDITVAEGTAEITLSVAVGPGLLQLRPVDVTLSAAKDLEGVWKVTAFSWRER